MASLKDTCLVMLSAMRVVKSVVFNGSGPLIDHTKSCELQQLNVDMSGVFGQQGLALLTSGKVEEKQIMQALQASAALITTLVMKLDTLLTMNTSDIAGSTNITTSNSSSTSSQDEAFTRLGLLLITCCNAVFMFCPEWPASDHSQYDTVRKALHNIMVFMHSVTHSSMSSMWRALVKQKGPGDRNQATAILSLLAGYINSMRNWPTSDARLVKELSALPPDFISLLCGLLLEEFQNLIAAAEITAIASAPSRSVDLPYVSSLVLLIFQLGEDLNNCIKVIDARKAAEELRMSGSGKIPGLERVLITPAVIAFYKFLVRTSCNHKNGHLASFVQTLIENLFGLLRQSGYLNQLAADAHSTQAVLQLLDSPTDALLGNYTPTLPVSDLSLIQQLLKQVPTPYIRTDLRYTLIALLMQLWTQDTDSCSPFQHPSMHEQDQGFYLVAHHCIAASNLWMRYQLHIQQQLPSSTCRAPSKQSLSASLREIMLRVFTNRVWRKRAANLANLAGRPLYRYCCYHAGNTTSTYPLSIAWNCH